MDPGDHSTHAPAAEPPVEYKASTWLLGMATAALLLFAALTVAAAIFPALPWFAGAVGVIGTLIGVGGMIELLTGRVRLEEDSLVVVHWFQTTRLPLADIAAVSLEGGLTSVRLKTGAWKRLPEWLGANTSLGRRLRDRLRDYSNP